MPVLSSGGRPGRACWVDSYLHGLFPVRGMNMVMLRQPVCNPQHAPARGVLVLSRGGWREQDQEDLFQEANPVLPDKHLLATL